jgi:hypothetical protein
LLLFQATIHPAAKRIFSPAFNGLRYRPRRDNSSNNSTGSAEDQQRDQRGTRGFTPRGIAANRVF